MDFMLERTGVPWRRGSWGRLEKSSIERVRDVSPAFEKRVCPSCIASKVRLSDVRSTDCKRFLQNAPQREVRASV